MPAELYERYLGRYSQALLQRLGRHGQAAVGAVDEVQMAAGLGSKAGQNGPGPTYIGGIRQFEPGTFMPLTLSRAGAICMQAHITYCSVTKIN
jgi:hypothetical protein